jgi:hypothetical protein
MPKIEANLKILENIAAEIFRLVSFQINNTPPDMHVDPYNMSINEGRDLLLQKSTNEQAIGINESIRNDISKMWLIKTKTTRNEFA